MRSLLRMSVRKAFGCIYVFTYVKKEGGEEDSDGNKGIKRVGSGPVCH